MALYCAAFKDQFFCVLAVHFLALRLPVGRVRATDIGAFINGNAQPRQSFQNVGFRARHETGLVGIFDAEEHLSTRLAGKKVVIKGSSYAPAVEGPGGAGRESNANG